VSQLVVPPHPPPGITDGFNRLLLACCGNKETAAKRRQRATTKLNMIVLLRAVSAAPLFPRSKISESRLVNSEALLFNLEACECEDAGVGIAFSRTLGTR
jgi:hypothetical protein